MTVRPVMTVRTMVAVRTMATMGPVIGAVRGGGRTDTESGEGHGHDYGNEEREDGSSHRPDPSTAGDGPAQELQRSGHLSDNAL